MAEQIDIKKVYEKLIEMEKKIISIELTINSDAFADNDDIESIAKAEEEKETGKLVSFEKFKQKRRGD
ncbi:MAG: hypothetical protein Q8N88_07040 [Nanoarchaeota archaeon]|nr:hypothetical protein [Nanoarchaeota archaeon]